VLAVHRRLKAEGARREVQRHERMGKPYMSGKATERSAMRQHRRDIAKQQNSLAAEYDGLAKPHEGESNN